MKVIWKLLILAVVGCGMYFTYDWFSSVKGIATDTQLISSVNKAITPDWIQSDIPVYEPEVFSIETKKWKKLDAEAHTYSCLATITGHYYSDPKLRYAANRKEFTITIKLEVTKSDPPSVSLIQE